MSDTATPPPPDYQAQAKAQGQENVETARVNSRLSNPDYFTPYGTQTVQHGKPGTFDEAGYNKALADYNQTLQLSKNAQQVSNFNGYDDAGNPTYNSNVAKDVQIGPAPNRQDFMIGYDPDYTAVTQTLSPEQQKLFDQDNRIKSQVGDIGEAQLGRVKDAFSQPFDMSGIPGLQYSVDPKYNTDGQQVQDALYQKQAQYLDPQFKQQQNDLSVQLANQGILPGSEAYQREMDNFARTKQQAYGDARNSAIIGAGQEQSRLFGLGLQSAELNNSTVNQGIQQKSFLRNLPLNELNALRSGSQATMPSFQGFTGSSAAPANTAQAYAQQQQYLQNQANAQNASNASTTNALVGLGTAGLGAYASYAGLAAMF